MKRFPTRKASAKFALLYFIPVFLLLFSYAVGGNAASAEQEKLFTQDDRFTYELRDGQAYITGYYGSETEVIVPGEIDGCPVVSVLFTHDNCEPNKTVKSVVLPESVIILERDAFFEYNALENVSGLEQIQTCGAFAFGYTHVSNLQFSASLQYLGTGALIPQQRSSFDDDQLFPSITIPDNAVLGDGFGEYLSEIHLIPSGDTPLWTLHEGVLYSADMKSLKLYPGGDRRLSYTIPDGVERIEASSFTQPYYLVDLVVPRSVTFFGNGAFISSTTYLNAMPCMQVYAESVAHRYCQNMGRPFHVIDADEAVQEVADRINSIVAQYITNDMSDYQKALVLHDWLIHNTVYDYTYNCYSPYNVLFQGMGVCEAYTDTYRLLLTAAGIKNANVAYQSHAWNLAYIGNAWYSIDTTWDDGQDEHKYFCLPSKLMALAQRGFDATTFLPSGASVNSLKWNYAFVNGAYSSLLSPYIQEIQQQIDRNQKRFSVPLRHTGEEEIIVLDIALNERAYEHTNGNDVFATIDAGNEVIWITLIESGTQIPSGMLFTINENEQAIITKYTGSSDTVIVPDYIGQYPVVGIGDNAFYNNEAVCSVILGNNITSIGDSAFLACRSLKSIALPDTLTSLGPYAFFNCTALQSIVLPDSVTALPIGVFGGCYALESIVLPKNLTDIGKSAFAGCNMLDFSIVIPETMTTVPNGAFTGCAKLRKVEFKGPVSRIESYAFIGCSALAEPSLPETLTYIGYRAFGDCNFAELHLPESLKEIDDYGLWHINGLKEIHLPAGIESIGSFAFKECRAAEKITIQAGNDHYTVIDNMLYTKDLKTLVYCPPNAQVSSVNVPYGTQTINGGAFQYCSSIEEITLPETVRTLGDSAFDGCASLRKINLPKNLTAIPENLFSGTALTSISIPDTVRTIGKGAFWMVPLSSLVVPDNISMVGWTAFGGLHLREFRIPQGVTGFTDNELYSSSIDTLIVHENFTTFTNQNGCVIGQIQGYPGTYAETLALVLGIPFVDISSVGLTGITVNKETADTGDQIVWQFPASGGYGSKKYLCERYVDDTLVDAVTLTDTDCYSVYADRPGLYSLKVTVTDAANGTAWIQDGWVQVSGRSLEITDISAPDELKTGQKGTWIVTAAGGVGERRCSLSVYFDGSMLECGDFSNNFTLSFTPKRAGQYTFVVSVADEGDSLVTRSFELQVKAGPLVIDRIDCTSAYASLGNRVRWDVSVSGGTGTTQYVYTVYSDDTVLSQSIASDEPFCEWLPDRCGNLVAEVTATDSDGNTCIGRSAPVRVDTYEPLAISYLYFNCSNVDENGNATLPVWYNITCYASGGKGSITYKYHVYLNGDTLGILTGVDKTEFPLSYISQGSGVLTGYVEVTDEEGNFASASFDPIVITEQSVLPRITSVYPDAVECMVGADITWRVRTKGGVGKLQYRYRLYDGEEIVTASEWSEEDRWTWTPDRAGSYHVQVTVQDERGFVDVLTSMNCKVRNGYATLYLPAAVQIIEEGAFENTAVEAVVLPRGITAIGPNAFKGCTSLVSVTIPDSVTDIAETAFSGCDRFVIRCASGSYAYTWAGSHGIRTEIIVP